MTAFLALMTCVGGMKRTKSMRHRRGWSGGRARSRSAAAVHPIVLRLCERLNQILSGGLQNVRRLGNVRTV